MKKILLWGLGREAKKYLKENYFGETCEILGFIDNYKNSETEHGFDVGGGVKLPVYTPKEFLALDVEYDYIVVANYFSDEIKEQCLGLGMDLGKMIFSMNYMLGEELSYEKRKNINFEDTWEHLEFAEKADPLCGIRVINKQQSDEQVLEISPKLYEELKEQQKNTFQSACAVDKIDNDSVLIHQEQYKIPVYHHDYVRYRTFEFASYEIKRSNIQGEVAEVGVFRGGFSKLINEIFHDRKLYLFDTFEGFEKDELKKEIEKGYCEGFEYETYSVTNVEVVMKKMKYPNYCVIRKGYFPKTAEGLENLRFAFVSIDVDLEDSIYESLAWFYPRLSEGGYLFVHDYNWETLWGVKAAVERYEKEFGRLKKVPIADRHGTLVITK